MTERRPRRVRRAGRPDRQRGLARRHPILTAGALVIGCIAVGAVVDALRIRSDLEAGRGALEELTLEDIRSSGGVGPMAEELQRRVDRADRRARRSVFFKVLEPVPLVGDQVRGVRSLSSTLSDLSDEAVRAATSVDRALDGANTPKGRLRLLDVALTELDAVEDAAKSTEADLSRRSTARLAPPLTSAHTSLRRALGSALGKVDEGRDAIEAARELLRGPSRYLVLAGNNAEMTAGSGMPLSVGVATLEDGEVSLGTFTPSSDLLLRHRVQPPGDLPKLYHPMGMGGDFRGTTATPNFPVAASVAREMAPRTPLGPVDGVLLVDAIALEDLIAATGPVTVDGIRFTAENVVEELLHRNYVRFGERGRTERENRTELQARVASKVFDALTTRDVELTDLLVSLRETAAGRHLLAWSPDPEIQDLWKQVGATGEIHPRGLIVSVQNYDGNKLDWYIRPEISLDVDATSNGDWLMTLTVSVTNPDLDPDEVGEVIIGPDPRYHHVLLDVHLPGRAYDITTTSRQGFKTRGADPPMQARTMIYEIARGETEVRTIHFKLPRDVEWMVLLPSARVVPTVYEVAGVELSDARAVAFGWPSPYDRPEPSRLPAAAAAMLAATASSALLFATRSRLVRGDGRLAGAPSRLEHRLPTVGLLLYLAAGAILVAAALSDGLG